MRVSRCELRFFINIDCTAATLGASCGYEEETIPAGDGGRDDYWWAVCALHAGSWNDVHGRRESRCEGVRAGDLPAGDLGPMGIIHGGGIPAVRVRSNRGLLGREDRGGRRYGRDDRLPSS